MSSIAIMQPYLFPYLGYFQLLNSVDLFVLYDDVQYMKGGWINRNRILEKNSPSYLTFPIKKDSTYLNINERSFSELSDMEKRKVLRRIEAAYKDAPHFTETYGILTRFLDREYKNAAEDIRLSFQMIQEYLGLPVNFVFSSTLKDTIGLKGLERVLTICRSLNADVYINAPGGASLYSKEAFLAQGISLQFIQPDPIVYEQFAPDFVPNLSIIDVLMFNSVGDIREMLNQFTLT